MSLAEFPSASLCSAVHRACSTAAWQQGTKLARGAAVALVRGGQDEQELRVSVPGWATSPTVVLYADGPEWACDCGGSEDPCPHIAASVLALEDARKRGASLLARSEPVDRIGYRFTRGRGDLAFSRVIVGSNGLETSLPSRLDPDAVVLTDADLAIDGALRDSDWASMSSKTRAAVLALLSRCNGVTLDGQAVLVRDEPVSARASITDHGDGFALTIEPERCVREVLGRGVVRTDLAVQPLGNVDLCGEQLEELPRTRMFAACDVADLVLDAVPELSRRMTVDVCTARLPSTVEGMAPRVGFKLAHVEHTLSVIPQLVYGEPPVACIQQGRLVHLQGPVPVRNLAAEVTLGLALHDTLDLVLDHRTEFTGTNAVRFAQRLRGWDLAQGQAAASSLGDRTLVARFTVRDDGFELAFETVPEPDETGGSPAAIADPNAVMHAYREGLDLVPLQGGGWASLPADWLARNGSLVADLLAARDPNGCIPPALRPALAELCDALEHPRPPALAHLAPLAEAFTSIPHAELPADLTATLRPYQRDGVDWLCFLRDAGLGAVLADDMGLGKTVQTLCAMRGRTLVVCPRSLVHNWLEEITRFRPALRAHVYHGPQRALDRDAGVTLTTYAVLRLDAAVLRAEHWDLVVLDEAPAIKNPESQAAQAAFSLEASVRIALSGTPVENHLDELWSLFHFTHRGLLGGRGDFDARYGSPIANGDLAAAARLRARVRPFLLRRLKREVAKDLPARTDLVLYCELSDSERAVYDVVRMASRKLVVDALGEGGRGTLAALEALLRLRQAACHPALVPGQHAETSAKVQRLVHALTDAVEDGHRALVFSQWTSLLDLLEPALRKANVPFTRLDGTTRDRGAVVREFQDDAGPPVLIASLKAGGTGLNLTAADHVFLLDPWWNPATEDQAADRAHRIGQTRPVIVHRLVARDTVEERILALQARKRGLAEAVLDGGTAAHALTRDDLLALVE